MKKVSGLILIIAIISGSLIGCEGARFEVGPAGTPEYVLTGTPVTIDLEVTNIGSTEGIYTASLKLDGVEIDSSEVTVAPGANEEVSLSFVIDEPGTYTVDINGMTAEVTALSPGDIIARVGEASGEVTTIQANMVMSVSMSMSKGEEKVEMEISMDSDFTVDNENQEMAIKMNMLSKVPDTGSVKGTVETYLIDDALYTRTNMAGTDSGWQKTESAAGSWDEYQIVKTQLDIAEYAEIEFLRTDTAGGENCFVFKIIPDKEVLMDALMSQQQINPSLAEESEDFTSIFSGLFGQMMEFDMEMWISEDTFLLKKTTITGDIDLAILAGFKMSIEMEISDIVYDEPVNIELPANTSLQ